MTLQLPLKLFVYNDDHEEVAKCVPTKLSKAALNSEAKWHGMHENFWRDHSMDRFKEFTLDLPENVNGFLTSNNPFFDCLPRREKHMLLMLEMQFPVQGVQVEDEIFDLSQCVSRFHEKNRATQVVIPTITPHGKLWMRKRGRYMLASEKAACMVIWNPSLYNSLTSSQIADVTGSAFEQTQALVVMAVRLAYMPLAF